MLFVLICFIIHLLNSGHFVRLQSFGFKNMKYGLNAETHCLLCNRHKNENLIHFFICYPKYNTIGCNILQQYNIQNKGSENLRILCADLIKQNINELIFYITPARQVRSFCLNVYQHTHL